MMESMGGFAVTGLLVAVVIVIIAKTVVPTRRSAEVVEFLEAALAPNARAWTF